MPEGEETFPGFTAEVKGVHFYRGKVKYDLEIKFAGDMATRIYNIDSVLVRPMTHESSPALVPNDVDMMFADLFAAIEHGDEEHRLWLKLELEKFKNKYFKKNLDSKE